MNATSLGLGPLHKPARAPAPEPDTFADHDDVEGQPTISIDGAFLRPFASPETKRMDGTSENAALAPPLDFGRNATAPLAPIPPPIPPPLDFGAPLAPSRMSEAPSRSVPPPSVRPPPSAPPSTAVLAPLRAPAPIAVVAGDSIRVESASRTNRPPAESPSRMSRPSLPSLPESPSRTNRPPPIGESASRTNRPPPIAESASRTNRPPPIPESPSRTNRPPPIPESPSRMSRPGFDPPARPPMPSAHMPAPQSSTPNAFGPPATGPHPPVPHGPGPHAAGGYPSVAHGSGSFGQTPAPPPMMHGAPMHPGPMHPGPMHPAPMASMHGTPPPPPRTGPPTAPGGHGRTYDFSAWNAPTIDEPGALASDLSYHVYRPGDLAPRPSRAPEALTPVRKPSVALRICMLLLGVCVVFGTAAAVIASSADEPRHGPKTAQSAVPPVATTAARPKVAVADPPPAPSPVVAPPPVATPAASPMNASAPVAPTAPKLADVKPADVKPSEPKRASDTRPSTPKGGAPNGSPSGAPSGLKGVAPPPNPY